MVKKLFFSFLLLFGAISGLAQDLNARVQILSPQVQNTNKRSLEVLELAIQDFLNNRKWTNFSVQPQERIDCYFVITLSEWDGSSNYKADAQIRSSRPVLDSDYTSPVLALTDPNFNFSYTQGEPLDFSPQQFTSNLSSLLAFYAYLIVGADADTFLPMGGEAAFQQANLVVMNAQNTNFAGWSPNETTVNRYWLNANLLDHNYQALRAFNFYFHAKILDELVDNPRVVKDLADLLPTLISVDRFARGAVYHQVFFTAKSEEFANLLTMMPVSDRLKAIAFLKEMDPAHGERYEDLRKLN